MKKGFYLLVFLLAVALAYAASQTSPSSSTNQPSGQVKPPTSGGQEQTPAPGMQTGPGSTAAASPGDAQSAIENALKNDPRLGRDNIMVSVTGNDINLTGDVGSEKEKDAAKSLAEKYAGSMRVKDHLKVTATEPQAGVAENTLSSSDLQAQIQNALKNEPTLSNDNVNVAVSEDEIDLSGAVTTAKEKLTAKRIVQSYAGNRKVKDHLTLKGHNPENPATNPDQSKNNPPKPDR